MPELIARQNIVVIVVKHTAASPATLREGKRREREGQRTFSFGASATKRASGCRSSNCVDVCGRSAPHPAFGHLLPAVRGEGKQKRGVYLALISWPRSAGRRCRAATD